MWQAMLVSNGVVARSCRAVRMLGATIRGRRIRVAFILKRANHHDPARLGRLDRRAETWHDGEEMYSYSPCGALSREGKVVWLTWSRADCKVPRT